MLKQPNLELAKQLLADFWLDHTETTVNAFWNDLKQEYPEYIWTKYWVEHFLNQAGLTKKDAGAFIIYCRDTKVDFSITASQYPLVIKDDEYYSQSKQQVMKLDTLSKPHIFNSLKKRYTNVTVEYILDNPDEEVTKLVKQYFR